MTFFVSKNQNNITFKAGLTAKFAKEIQSTNIAKISKKLAKKNIETNFKNNKTIAWCNEKVIDIFQQLNDSFGLKLDMPKGIFVEDFENLNLTDSSIPSFCNLTPTKLKKNSDEIIPSRTIFFNTFESVLKKTSNEKKWLYSWDYVCKIADLNYKTNKLSTDHFLEKFLHEMIHVIHLNKLLNKFGGKALLKKLESVQDKKQIEQYQKIFGEKIKTICKYALTNQLEAIACDASRIIMDSLNKRTLQPIKNPFTNTPYENLSFLKKIKIPAYSKEDMPLKEILRNFWNGTFD